MERQWERDRAQREANRPPPPPTVGDLRAVLYGYDPMSLLVVAYRCSVGYDVSERLADQMLVKAFYPRRHARVGEIGYVEGQGNIIEDRTQPQRVIIRIGRKEEIHIPNKPMPPRKGTIGDAITVQDLLKELAKLDDTLILVDSGHEDARWTEDARNIASKEFAVTRLAKPGDPEYLEGAKNRKYDWPRRVSVWVNSTDFSQYNYMD